MRLFVGLGNPGARYAGNRHNIGFMAVERIAGDHGFSPWRSRFQGRTAEGMPGGSKTILLCPETFMNLSGQSVAAAAKFYKIAPGDIWVFHDEIDLAAAKLKVKTGGGHAGHNGLRSIHQHIGPDYGRVRMGVGHPGHKDAVPGYVLHDFAKADAGWLDDMLRGVSDGAVALAAGDAAAFSNAVGMRLSPQRPSGGTGPSGGAAVRKPARSTGQAATPRSPATEGEAPAAGPDGAGRNHDASRGGADTTSRSVLRRLADRFR